jgi:8-oxo-dGTP diphosphatase
MTDWARPALTVDVALLAQSPQPSILLVQRAHDPFAGSWALPGGFVEKDERARDAAARELAEETGVQAPALSLLDVYDTPGRDPRGWTVSVTFVGRISERVEVHAADDANDAAWFPLEHLPKLAFDHALIVADAVSRLTS